MNIKGSPAFRKASTPGLRSDGPASAVDCMRLDQEMLEGRAGNRVIGRIYEWDGPAVSLGRSNDASRLDAGILAASGVAVVRRPTGGAALIHGTDLCYSVAYPRRQLAGRRAGLMETGRLLASPVLQGLRSLGIDARFRAPVGAPVRGGEELELCFLQKSFLDIMVGDRKVAAFAQRATSTIFFQHGSVLMEPVPDDLVATLTRAGLGSRDEWKAVRRETASVGGPGKPGREEVRRAILEAARLSAVLTEDEVNPARQRGTGLSLGGDA